MGETLQEKVLVVVETMFKGMNRIPEFNKGLDKMRIRMNSANRVIGESSMGFLSGNTVLKRFRNTYDGFFKVLGASLPEYRLLAQNQELVNTTGAKMGLRFRNLTHGLRGFRMELLGTMFFGMALVRFFSGLLRPSLELVGVFELFTVLLQVTFLPLAIELMNVFVKLFKFFVNMSDETKATIGKFVLFGLILGGFFSLIGMLGLGLGSLIQAFSGVFNIIDLIIPDITVLGVDISSFIEAGLGVALVSKAWTIFKKVIKGVTERILELDFIRDMLDLMGIKIDENSSIWESLGKAISAILKKVGIDLDLSSPFGILSGLIDGIKEQGQKWFDSFKEGIDGIPLDSFMETLDGLLTWISDNTPTLEDFVENFETLTAWLEKMPIEDVKGDFSKLIDVISDIAFMNSLTSLAHSLELVAESLTAIKNAASSAKSKLNSLKSWVSRHWEGLLSRFADVETMEERYRITPRANDFIWRSGEGAMMINPKDTVIGYKGESPLTGGGGGNVNISPTYNISVSDGMEMVRLIEENNKSLVDELRRLVKA